MIVKIIYIWSYLTKALNFLFDQKGISLKVGG